MGGRLIHKVDLYTSKYGKWLESCCMVGVNKSNFSDDFGGTFEIVSKDAFICNQTRVTSKLI